MIAPARRKKVTGEATYSKNVLNVYNYDPIKQKEMEVRYDVVTNIIDPDAVKKAELKLRKRQRLDFVISVAIFIVAALVLALVSLFL